MRTKITPALVASALLAGSLVACGGGTQEDVEPQTPISTVTSSDGAASVDPTAPSGTTITVTSHEFGFEPMDITAPADTDVTVEFVNDGSLEHDWAIQDQNVIIKAGPGQSATGTFNLPAGSYTVLCTVPGHEAEGMTGTLTVE